MNEKAVQTIVKPWQAKFFWGMVFLHFKKFVVVIDLYAVKIRIWRLRT